MKLTKQRKVYAAFLGLAAMAFAADRMFFLPAGAAAAPQPLLEAATPHETTPKDSAPAESTEPTLAERLRTASQSVPADSGSDPFRAKWHVAAKPAEPKTTPAGQSPAEYFAANHKLTGVSKPKAADGSKAGDEESGWAQIAGKSENKTYRLGDSVDGWTLISVSIEAGNMSATLESPAGTVTLHLGQSAKGR